MITSMLGPVSHFYESNECYDRLPDSSLLNARRTGNFLRDFLLRKFCQSYSDKTKTLPQHYLKIVVGQNLTKASLYSKQVNNFLATKWVVGLVYSSPIKLTCFLYAEEWLITTLHIIIAHPKSIISLHYVFHTYIIIDIKSKGSQQYKV